MKTMKIVGGSFGVTGLATLNSNTKQVSVESARNATFSTGDIETAHATSDSTKKTSVLSVLLGLFILTPLLFFFFNIIGLIIGIVLSIVGSAFTVQKNRVEVKFRTGETLLLEGSQSAVNTFIHAATPSA